MSCNGGYASFSSVWPSRKGWFPIERQVSSMASRIFPADMSAADGPVAAIRGSAAAGNPQRGWLSIGPKTVPVALGRGGIKANKREGDGGTPRGIFRPRRLWWRADRYPRPRTFLPARALRPEDAWCEDPSSRHYNQPLRLDRDQSGDRLRRDDHLYDFIVEIDHKSSPRVAGRGSAVF